MGTPLVSIIIPAFNAETYLAEAIGSVLSQQGDMEVIVVDDASTDGTAQIAQSLGDRVRVISLPENRGTAAARNAGMQQANGSFIGFLDADDRWFPGAVQHLLPPLQSGKYDFVRGLTKFFREKEGGIELQNQAFTEVQIGTTLYTKETIEKVGLFDEELRYAEDMDWNMRLHEAGCLGKRIDVPILQYRRHGNNLTNDETLVKEGMLAAFRKKFNRVRQPAS